MTAKLKSLINAVRELSPGEQLELIRAVTQLLDTSCRQKPSEDFWKPGSVEDIEGVSEIPVVSNLTDLAVDFWPEDESSDALINYIYKQRQEDRLSD